MSATDRETEVNWTNMHANMVCSIYRGGHRKGCAGQPKGNNGGVQQSIHDLKSFPNADN
jgi:hypothetical protein